MRLCLHTTVIIPSWWFYVRVCSVKAGSVLFCSDLLHLVEEVIMVCGGDSGDVGNIFGGMRK